MERNPSRRQRRPLPPPVLPPGSSRLLRVHGAFVTEQEIGRLTSYLRKTAKPVYDDTVGKTGETTSPTMR